MNIIILGKGNIGTPLAKLVKKAGYSVYSFNSKDDPLDAIKIADIVILAMKYEQALLLSENSILTEALSGKILIDLTNPLSPDFMNLTIGHDTSAAEEISLRLPNSKIVKAFNTILAPVFEKQVSGASTSIPVFVAGNDLNAVNVVTDFIQRIGFNTINAGPLTNARYLEPLTELTIQFAYALGFGGEVGIGLIRD